MKQWIANKACSVEEAYKLFDIDFDGTVSKQDLN